MSIKKKKYGLKAIEDTYGKLTIADFLRSWRLSEELNQREFAEKLKMSPANLCDIECGRKGISIEKALEISTKIGYPPAALIKIVLQDQLASAGVELEIILKNAA